MRGVLLVWLFVVGVVVFGWPSHWIVAAAAFVAGLLSVVPSDFPKDGPRGGYLHPPSTLNDRIGRYTEPRRER